MAALACAVLLGFAGRATAWREPLALIVGLWSVWRIEQRLGQRLRAQWEGRLVMAHLCVVACRARTPAPPGWTPCWNTLTIAAAGQLAGAGGRVRLSTRRLVGRQPLARPTHLCRWRATSNPHFAEAG